jgi:hypothetical protein
MYSKQNLLVDYDHVGHDPEGRHDMFLGYLLKNCMDEHISFFRVKY